MRLIEGLHFRVGLLLVRHRFRFLFSTLLFYTKLLGEVVSLILTQGVLKRARS